MDYEEIIINLKIIGKIEVNQKLITRDTYLNIEKNSIIPEWFRRWNRQDNRNEALKKINKVVDESVKLLSEKNSQDLRDYMSESIKGLNHLKETYSICNQTKSRIEIIIDKINQSINSL